ncbi:phospholipase D family protein [Thalassotalea ponticola]|uniref:phospholipase D family protein n=1 Tax=Thalassotalea ponticola TaxID=1523392 RepID=UPI0025B469AE|nr:phospholipase D family protein [Thalassotalea ponticola]MDN3651838.1 phospholipase D family protein [Thalassotalea ponticola]
MLQRNQAKSLLVAVFLLLISACAQLPERDNIEPSYAIAANTPSLIASAIKDHDPELSGFHPLADGVDAFVARLALIQAAEHTIDVQYYLYHRQQTTLIFTKFLLDAANRGVRVRLLLDDLGQAENEIDLAALAVHPNFEIRLFNPFPNRAVRAMGFITDYGQLSRRMHNKSFIVDNRVFITGGRNMGNAYFSATDTSEFIDLDVMAVGKIVPEASTAFDLYWNHSLSYPIELLRGTSTQQALASVGNELTDYLIANENSNYVNLLKQSTFVDRLLGQELNLDWQPALLFYDHPDKLINNVDDKSANMSAALFEEMGDPSNQAIIVSPYFIPTEQGVELLSKWTQNGVEVIVLTNSLSATDVAAVHSGYAKYRTDLLRAGVQLWELKPSDLVAKKRKKGKKISGSSQASLHAKTMAFDDKKIFIGTMNLDPRSFHLNTEMGVLIASEKLSSLLAQWIDEKLAEYAWQVELEQPNTDALIWSDKLSGERFDNEPKTSAWERFKVWFISLLPVEDQL